MKIKLGKKYRDKVHQIVGTATCVSSFLSGCERVCLEFVKDGEVKSLWVDAPMLEAVHGEKAVAKPSEPEKRGGPGPVAPSRTTG